MTGPNHAFLGADARRVGGRLGELLATGFEGKRKVHTVNIPGLSVWWSDDMAGVGDHLAPTWAVFELPADAASPGVHVRIEVRNGAPRVVSIEVAADERGEIRQGDVRAIDIDEMIRWYSALAMRLEETDEGGARIVVASATAEATMTRARAKRRLSRSFLADVADVYRENLASAPTKAVQDRFLVSPRTASGYVQAARREGLLPPTTRGRKQA